MSRSAPKTTSDEKAQELARASARRLADGTEKKERHEATMASQPNLLAQSTCKASPKYSFPGAPLQKRDKKDTVGPGQYSQTNVDKDKFQRSASWAIGSGQRAVGSSYCRQPGPGAYALHPEQVGKKWVFGSEKKLPEVKRRDVPGPGAYEVRSKIDLGPISIASRVAPPEKRADVPGPGSYKPVHDSRSHFTSMPGIGFGTASRSDLLLSKAPGPGHYENVTTLCGNIATNTPAKYSIKGKYPPRKLAESPMPCMAATQFR